MKYYTYHIYWTQTNTHYYGVRGTELDPKEDLWIKYFTSSKYVKQHRKLYGEPNLIEIRKVFGDRPTALEWENRVLLRIGARKSNKWLNRYDGKYHGAPGPKNHGHKISSATKGVKKSTEHCHSLSKAIKGSFHWFTNGLTNMKVKVADIKDFLANNPTYYKGKYVSVQSRKKLSDSRLKGVAEGTIVVIGRDMTGENNPMFGKTQKEETKNIIKMKAKTRMLDATNKPFGEKNGMYGKKHSEQYKAQASIRTANKRWYTNEIINIYIDKDQEPPSGFRKGKKKCVRRTKAEMMADTADKIK